MMKRIILMVLIAVAFIPYANAQDHVSINAYSQNISDNFELEAVIDLFGKTENIEQFEYQLNNPELGVSNLDLNNDGQVDYLRVLETADGANRRILIQAVIGADLFQDVAEIDVVKNQQNVIRVQIVGNPFIYGNGYIIEPVYAYAPPIYSWFWSDFYSPWYSPYYYGYYPRYYNPYRVCGLKIYRNRLSSRERFIRDYYYSSKRIAGVNHNSNKYYRSDYSKNNPDKSFANNNRGVKNYSYVNRNLNSNSSKTWTKANANRDRVKNTNKVYSNNNSSSTNKTYSSYRKSNSRTNNNSSNNSTRVKSSTSNSKSTPRASRSSNSSSRNSSTNSSSRSSSNKSTIAKREAR